MEQLVQIPSLAHSQWIPLPIIGDATITNCRFLGKLVKEDRALVFRLGRIDVNINHVLALNVCHKPFSQDLTEEALGEQV